MSNTDHDLVIRNGQVVTPDGVVHADIAVAAGRIHAIGPALPGRGAAEIDARDRYVLPGGVDPHVHIEQVSAGGLLNADTFESGTVAAAFGGTTTVIPFAAQHRGLALDAVVADYHALARRGAVIDYAFHMILGDPTPTTLTDHLPPLVAAGHTSIKIFMTYDRLKLEDAQILEVLAAARRLGALVCVHAENHAMISFAGHALAAAGKTEIRHFCASHPRLAEVEAINRLAVFAEFLDQPVMVFHVSTREGAEVVARAQARGVPLYAETCPQYLFLTEDAVERPGVEGAKWMCSPPLRRPDDVDALWAALARDEIEIVSSDHAPYRLDATGKLSAGPQPTFKEIANGLPGVETRLPLLFDAMVTRGRAGIERFVAVTSATPARRYGLAPRKGAIVPGADADIAIWNPSRRVRLDATILHDRTGYTPYEGLEVTGWPETVLSRGRVIIHDEACHAAPGSGLFLPRTPQPRA